MTREQRLREFAAAAVRAERDCGYPPRLLIAQWAAESDWGRRTSGEHNYFGVTFQAKRHRGFRYCPTSEELTETQIRMLPPDERATIRGRQPIGGGRYRVELDRKFASYATLEEAIADKIDLIMRTSRYRKEFEEYRRSGDVEALMEGIAGKGYATASHYAELLKKIGRQANVLAAIEEARRAG